MLTYIIFLITLLGCNQQQQNNEYAIKNIEGIWELSGKLLFENKDIRNIKDDTLFFWYKLIDSSATQGFYQVIQFRTGSFEYSPEPGPAAKYLKNNYKASTCLLQMYYNNHLGLFNATQVDADDTTTLQFTYKGGNKIYYQWFETANDDQNEFNSLVGNGELN